MMYTEFFTPLHNGGEIILRPGQTHTFSLRGDVPNPDEALKLFIAGEVALGYQWQSEADYPAQYRTIDDALDTTNGEKSWYCLNLSNPTHVAYEKRLYKRMDWPPVLSYLPMTPYTPQFEMSLRVKATDLQVADEGYIRMVLTVNGEPEYTLDIPPGSYPWQKISIPTIIPKADTDYIGVWIEGVSYTGEIFVEQPALTSSTGWNLLPEFMPTVPDKEKFVWSGQNISRKEWPEFRITLNEHVVFEGAQFDRSHRGSQWSVPLPHGLLKPQDNQVAITLTSPYREAPPYLIQEAGLIATPNAPITLVAVPDIAPANGFAHVLVKVSAPSGTLAFASENGALSVVSSLTFDRPGLHPIRLQCGEAQFGAPFTLTLDGFTASGHIGRIVERPTDHVITGTSDIVYIPQDIDAIEEFLCFYFSNKIGDLVNMRPTYRWSGTRELNPAAYAYLIEVLNGMGVKYAHIIDGRELPGKASNPTEAMLQGPGFLGRQDHERDGSQFYWARRSASSSPTIQQYHEMETRLYEETPEQVQSRASRGNAFKEGRDVWRFRPYQMPNDIKEAAAFQLDMLRNERYHQIRHTAPSVMFKYFYEAGYEWQGAETMYTSMEPHLAFLRGAAACYGKKEMGVHHALQWSSSPHDTPERFRRYRLALFVSWLQGVTEINTEEGLWHMEEYFARFNRFSRACQGHIQQHQDFYRYISAHARTGTFYTPIGLLHGRLDGWHGFGNARQWGIFHAQHTVAEKSWDLLKLFYPLSKPGSTLYRHNCPNEPVGYYTGTPHGSVDVVPVESPEALLAKYKVLAFMGYNYATAEDLTKLQKYVENGGKLILTKAHLATTTNLDSLAANQLDFLSHPLTDLLATAGEGLSEIPLGAGSIIFVNEEKYPAHEDVRSVYEAAVMAATQAAIAQENAYVTCGNDIEFAIYDQGGAKHIYLLAVDWFNDPEEVRHATLRVGAEEYLVEVPFGTPVKVVVQDDVAAWASSENGDVLDISHGLATVQGMGNVVYAIAKGGMLQERCVSFADGPLVKIEV